MSVAVVDADSDEGRLALRAASREAADRNQPLIVLSALDDPSDVDTVRTRVQKVLGDTGWDVLSAVHEGDPVGTVVELLARSGAERVVIGSRSRTATGKFLVERHVQRVIIESPVPILVVKTD